MRVEEDGLYMLRKKGEAAVSSPRIVPQGLKPR
jgi:hypothetical protein